MERGNWNWRLCCWSYYSSFGGIFLVASLKFLMLAVRDREIRKTRSSLRHRSFTKVPCHDGSHCRIHCERAMPWGELSEHCRNLMGWLFICSPWQRHSTLTTANPGLTGDRSGNWSSGASDRGALAAIELDHRARTACTVGRDPEQAMVGRPRDDHDMGRIAGPRT